MTKDEQNIVYYTGFWYSNFSPIGISSSDLILNQQKYFERLKADLRMLSLIFDVIHVPRSHLLTFQNETNWVVVNKYINDHDFIVLVENKIILSSILPSIDSYSDSERIVERVNKNDWSKNINIQFINVIKNIDTVKIDSKRESINNVDLFQQYIEFQNPKTQLQLNEIKKRSLYKDTPFLHEKFVEELLKNDEIDNSSKNMIWKATNTFYITHGCMDLGDNRRISLNQKSEIEEASKRDNTGFLRELYSPKFLEMLILEELGDRSLIKFRSMKIDELIKFRELPSWKFFKAEIFSMFEILSDLEKNNPTKFAEYKDSEKLLKYKSHVIGGDKGWLTNIMTELMEASINSANNQLGKPSKAVLRVFFDKALEKYAEWKISKHQKHYQEFWNELKKLLDEKPL